MTDFTVSAGQPIRATHVNQFSRWLVGTTKNHTTAIANTHATEYTLTLTNEHTSVGNVLKLVSGSSTIALFNKTGVTITPAATFSGGIVGLTFTNATIAGTFQVTGASTFTGVGTFVTGVTIGGTLVVTGAGTFTGFGTFLTGVAIGGALTVTGAGTFVTGVTIGGGLSVTGPRTYTALISPSETAVALHNYNPTGFSTAAVVQLNLATAASLTGLAAQTAGRQVSLRNISSFTLTLEHEDGGSTDVNRIRLPGQTDATLITYQTVLLYYDGTRWYRAA